MELEPNESEMPMEDEDLELSEKKYTEHVDISIDGSLIGWGPVGSGLYPDPDDQDAIEFADSIREFIYANDQGGMISATPEGPFFEASTTDLGAVIWAINVLYGSELPIKITGPAPSLSDLGLDAASNFDEDGTEIVR
jgi:hypothetical protein